MNAITKAFKIGIDLGGTKISSIILGDDGRFFEHTRIASPQNSYDHTLSTLADLIQQKQRDLAGEVYVGIGIPGSISPHTRLVQNANSTWLNGKPLHKDLAALVDNPVRFANDADCFALSEAVDGAGKDYNSVFGVIIGTGCGGGLVSKQELNTGPLGISGEWGHNPLPWPDHSELKQNKCWCGRFDCIETWVSGPGLSRDHKRNGGELISAEEIASLAENGIMTAVKTIQRYTSRLARGLASCINFQDPDVIVLGGGLSKIGTLYDNLPSEIAPYLFCDHKQVIVKRPVFGDDSGVRGAARLWNT